MKSNCLNPYQNSGNMVSRTLKTYQPILEILNEESVENIH
jgi:hypothetical protein